MVTITTLRNGDVHLAGEVFDDVTRTATPVSETYRAIGPCVHAVLTNGKTAEIFDGLMLSGPTVATRPDEPLAHTIRNRLCRK